MATHSSTLPWKILWTEEPDRLQSMGSRRVRHEWATSLSRVGEGNGNPLQCSCLENPRDGEPGRLPSMRSHRVGHDWSDLAVALSSSKETEELYTWNYKTLMKEIKGNINRWRDISCFCKESILWKWPYYQMQSTDSLRSLSNYQWHFSQN